MIYTRSGADAWQNGMLWFPRAQATGIGEPCSSDRVPLTSANQGRKPRCRNWTPTKRSFPISTA